MFHLDIPDRGDHDKPLSPRRPSHAPVFDEMACPCPCGVGRIATWWRSEPFHSGGCGRIECENCEQRYELAVHSPKDVRLYRRADLRRARATHDRAKAVLDATPVIADLRRELSELLAGERTKAGKFRLLEAELRQIATRLQARQVAVRQAMSAVIVAEVYQRAIDEHRAAWLQLRTAKEKLRILAAALQGQGPDTLLDEISLAEPTEIRFGYPVLTEQIEPLRQWLEALENDPEARLE